MENNYILGTWYITILTNDKQIESGKPAWVGVNYQQEAPQNQNDVSPDWGFGHDGDTVEEAAIECVKTVWHAQDGTLNKAVELAATMVMLGILPCNYRITDSAALIDGRWFFGQADERKHGIAPWNEFLKYYNVSEFGFSKEGKDLAEKIERAAIEEDEEFQRGYAAWESSWIDGPQ